MAISYCYLVPFSKDLTFTFLFWKKEGNNNMQFCHLTLPAKVIQTLGNFVNLWNTTQLERKQLKCCRRASFVKKKKKKKKKKAIALLICSSCEYHYTSDNRKQGRIKERAWFAGGGELTWRLLIPFVLQFVITPLTRDCSAHKTRKAPNHIVYIMSRAHTVNTRCAYTLNLEYTQTKRAEDRKSHQWR